MTAPRHWPCWKGWRAASPWAISAIGVNNEPPSGPRKRACWFSHAPMPRRKSACWPKCGRASRLRFRSYGTAFSTVSFRALGVACGTRSNSRSFTTTYGMPASSLNNELKTGVFLGSDFVQQARRVAEWLIGHTGGKASIVELTGTVGSSVALDRSRGFAERIADHPGMRIIASQTADFSRATAQRVMENIVQVKGGE